MHASQFTLTDYEEIIVNDVVTNKVHYFLPHIELQFDPLTLKNYI